MQDYRPNSHRFREEQKSLATTERKKLEKVVSGPVTIRKKSEFRKIVDSFIVEDAKSVGQYVVDEIIVPTIRDTIWSIFTNSLEMFIYGGGSSRGKKRPSSSPYVSYRDYSSPSRREERRSYDEPRVRGNFGCDEILFKSWAAADEVLTGLKEAIDEYEVASINDLYDLIGETCPYPGCDHGWTNLSNAKPVPVRGGFILKLPKAAPIRHMR